MSISNNNANSSNNDRALIAGPSRQAVAQMTQAANTVFRDEPTYNGWYERVREVSFEDGTGGKWSAKETTRYHPSAKHTIVTGAVDTVKGLFSQKALR
jgi:hypothetical protein